MDRLTGQRIRLTSFLLPPLPKEIFINYGNYKQLKHWANWGFYGTHSIQAAIELIKRKVKEEEERERKS